MATKIPNFILLIAVAMMISSARAEYYCGRSNACYMVPNGCAYGDCDFEVVWSQQENTTKYDFKIAARHNGWVAVGFSNDQVMGGDDVLMCIADGDGARFEHRYNSGRSNILVPESDAVMITETRNLNGVISCRVERDLSITNNGMTFDLSSDWHMFFGKGPLLSGSPVQHSEIPQITKVKVDFAELVVLAMNDFEGQETGDGDDNAGAGVKQAGILLILINVMLVLISMHH